MRRVVLTSLVQGALVAGGAAIALAGSGSPPTRITKAEAVTFAKAVNLGANDLPRAIPGPTQITKSPESKIVRCARPGKVVERPLDEAGLFFLTRYGIEGSLVRVMPTDAAAAADLAAVDSRRGHVCFARSAQLKLKVGSTTLSSKLIAVVFIRLVKLLGTGAIGVHTVSKPLHTPGVAPFHSHLVLFRVGPAEVFFVAIGQVELPSATEGRLLALLHTRAEAHQLP